MTPVRRDEADRVKRALEQVWAEERPLVDSLGLSYRPQLIEQMPEGWVVHVNVGTRDWDASRVIGAIDAIGRTLSEKTDLFVVALYDPGLEFAAHGPRPFAEVTNGIRPQGH